MDGFRFRFAANLRRARQTAGLKQRDLADRLFVSPQTVSKWEQGLTFPDIENLCRLASLLGVTVDALLADDRAPQGPAAYLGIDGGGTKTDFALCDADGKILRRVTREGCNPSVCGMDRAREILLGGIDALGVADFDLRGAFAGIAGCSQFARGSVLPVGVSGSDLQDVCVFSPVSGASDGPAAGKKSDGPDRVGIASGPAVSNSPDRVGKANDPAVSDSSSPDRVGLANGPAVSNSNGPDRVWRTDLPATRESNSPDRVGIANDPAVSDSSSPDPISEGLFAILSERLPGVPLGVGSDIVNVVWSTDLRDDLVAAICGTGSIAYAKKGPRLLRVGGWGPLFDLAGSGFDIGRDAIRAALADEDGLGDHTTLTAAVHTRCGGPLLDTVGNIPPTAYSEVASYAPLVFSAARAGDRVADGILARNFGRLADLIGTAVRRYDCPPRIVLAGGVTREEDVVRRYLVPRLPAGHTLVIPDVPPLFGALAAARETAEKKAAERPL